MNLNLSKRAGATVLAALRHFAGKLQRESNSFRGTDIERLATGNGSFAPMTEHEVEGLVTYIK